VDSKISIPFPLVKNVDDFSNSKEETPLEIESSSNPKLVDKDIQSVSIDESTSEQLTIPHSEEKTSATDSIFESKTKSENSPDSSVVDLLPEEEKAERQWRFNSSIGLGIQGYHHISRSFIENSMGGAVGLESRLRINRLGFDIGLYFGGFEHEIDDVELVSIRRLNAFPGGTIDPNSIDDIVVYSKNIFIPISFSYRFLRKNDFYAAMKMGALGNVVMQERFSYLLDFPEESEVNVAASSGSVNLSHFQFGLDAGYDLNNKWAFEIGAGYFHPIKEIGTLAFSNSLIGAKIVLVRNF
jgi:hypothetical protein